MSILGTFRTKTRNSSKRTSRELARALPSQNSRDYGRSFAELFTDAGFDFYKLDGALFAPAEVWVSHLGSGQTWHAGRLNMELLRGLWRQDAAVR